MHFLHPISLVSLCKWLKTCMPNWDTTSSCPRYTFLYSRLYIGTMSRYSLHNLNREVFEPHTEVLTGCSYPQLSQSGIWRVVVLTLSLCLYSWVYFHVKFNYWHVRFCLSWNLLLFVYIRSVVFLLQLVYHLPTISTVCLRKSDRYQFDNNGVTYWIQPFSELCVSLWLRAIERQMFWWWLSC